uniref:Variant surface glycoprotein 1125.1488 n=1 Tax=Trypanosoma brucei TaxID=5691 RepID=A0A1J0R7E5_9TRYP|nr:variant surface glycoprotein 1125.1488 [Trypanosoma brucei]
MIRAIATIALLSAGAASATTPADDDNITFEPARQTASADISDLLALNMSLADETWQAKFKQPKSEKSSSSDMEREQEATPGTETEVTAWTSAAEAINSKTKLDAVLKPYGYDSTNMSLLATAPQAIKHYTALAFDAQQQLAAISIGDKPDIELKQALDKAIYGAAGGYNPAATPTAGLATAAGREAVCEQSGEHNPVKTIPTMVACVCAVKKGMLAAKAPCGPNTETTVTWQPAGLPALAAWNKLRTRCPVLSDATITASKVEHALNKAKQAFYNKEINLYVGKYNSSGCNGSDNGACIKYINQAQPTYPNSTKRSGLAS